QQAAVQNAYGSTPLMFEANMGQTDSSVQFIVRGGGATTFLTSTEAVMVLPHASAASSQSPPDSLQETTGSVAQEPPEVGRLQLVGSNANAQAVGEGLLETKTNYFIGNDPSRWHTNISNFANVIYQGVYAGVDLAYHGGGAEQNQLEFDFVVAPG